MKKETKLKSIEIIPGVAHANIAWETFVYDDDGGRFGDAQITRASEPLEKLSELVPEIIAALPAAVRDAVELAADAQTIVRLQTQIAALISRDAPAAPELVRTVSMTQARLALFDLHGIQTDEQFFGLVDVLPEESRQRARVELATRATVAADNDLVAAVCDAKGWDKAGLFEYAATL